jgi:hypothetical protein
MAEAAARIYSGDTASHIINLRADGQEQKLIPRPKHLDKWGAMLAGYLRKSVPGRIFDCPCTFLPPGTSHPSLRPDWRDLTRQEQILTSSTQQILIGNAVTIGRGDHSGATTPPRPAKADESH